MLGLVPISAAPISALAGQSGPIFIAPIATGGLQPGGAATTKRRTTYKPTGGLQLSGTSLCGFNPLGIKVAPNATGGLVAGGTGDPYKNTAISLVATSAFASGMAALTVVNPAGGQAGDFELLFVESANQAVTLPSGFTEVPNSPQFTGTAAAAGGVRLAVFYRWWVDNTSSVTVGDTGNHQTASRLYFREVDQASPFDVTPVGGVQATPATAWSVPAISTISSDSMIVLAVANDLDTAQTNTALSAWGNASLYQLTQRLDQTIASGVGGGLGIATGLQFLAGDTGATSVTNSSSVTAAFLTIALRHTLRPLGLRVAVQLGGGLIYAGTASVSRFHDVGVYLPTGGLIYAGTASVSKWFLYLPTGGLVFSGTAPVSVVFSTGSVFTAPPPTGGLVTGGTAFVNRAWSRGGVGGCQFGGSAEVWPRRYQYLPTGGLVHAGAATAYSTHDIAQYVSVGGLSFGTSSAKRWSTWFRPTVSGGIQSGTAGVTSRLHRYTYTRLKGGAKFGGEAASKFRELYGVTSVAGIMLSGSAISSMNRRRYTPTGGFTLGSGTIIGRTILRDSVCAINCTGNAGCALIRPITRADSPSAISPFNPNSSLFHQLDKVYTTTGNVERIMV